MRRLAILFALTCVGCVNVSIPVSVVADRSKAETRSGAQDLDVFHTTASTRSSSGTSNSTTQTADAKLDIPISATGQ